ncbi:hypothetical protein EVAR_87756_1 [Eumeta japonica]|uniref:Uncharacterized protein n=1 Tax=Eumeta variegata TaxID=151549 RepID=A0A4C1TEB3_EUMVA|nr:hypothetical protein EVAR_87756_1 [Eumeta japonica]
MDRGGSGEVELLSRGCACHGCLPGGVQPAAPAPPSITALLNYTAFNTARWRVSSQRFCYESRSSIFVAHSPRFFFASPSIFSLLPLFVDPARRTTVGDRLFVQTFDSNSKGYPTDDALVGCYVLGRHSAVLPT